MKVDDLYFGVMYMDSNTRLMTRVNLFDLSRIRERVAHWVAYPDKRIGDVHTCFFDVCGRCEYEWAVDGLFSKDMNQTSQKVDVYDMYVVPNIDHLADMISKVSKNSALQYLRAERKRRKGLTK